MEASRIWKTITGLLCLVTVGLARAEAQSPQEQPDMNLDAKLRTEVIDTIAKLLNQSYVFPETAKKMEAALREHVANRDYDSITSAKTFAATLTSHLQAISKDKHLRVRYSYEPMPERDHDQPTKAEIEDFRAYCRHANYGFEKVERLEGNIGYVDLRGFFDPQDGGATVAAAMSFLANTDALIIDLRQNGGGDPAMVQVICSYFFDEPTHLNDLYFRPSDSTQQFWTLPYVPGKRYLEKPVYVLTSKRTFSGAEEFTYNLKNLKRATIIGETTGGGAHPGDVARINAHFSVFVPQGRAINPITKSNWEGTGVTPDVDVPADQALLTAQVAAVKSVISKTPDSKSGQDLQDSLNRLQKDLDALKEQNLKGQKEKPAR